MHWTRPPPRDSFNPVIHIMVFKSATTLHALSLEVQQQNVTSSNVRISAVAHDVLLLINGKYIICGYI